MRHVIRLVTHMIVSGTYMLLFTNVFENSWELAGYSLITMVLVGVLYGLRSKTKSFWMFLGSHVVLIVGGNFLIPMLGAYKWYIAIWCFWIVYSVFLRLAPIAENLDEPGAFYVVVLAVAYFVVCFLEGSIFTQRLSLISTALVFLLYLLYRNMDSMDEFILVGSFSNKIDEQGIRKLNHRLSLLYIGMLGTLLGVFGLFRVDGLWHTLAKWLRILIRFFVSLLPMPKPIQPEEGAGMEQSMLQLLQEMVPEKEPPAWIQLLGEILRDIVVFVVVLGVLVGVIRVAIRVYRNFYNKENREEGDKVIEALSFGGEITKERKPGFFERFERSPARRIRKTYKKSLKRVGTKQMPKLRYMAPEEQVQYLRKQGMPEEAIDEIKSLYEKARYSREVVTESEAERMRAIL